MAGKLKIEMSDRSSRCPTLRSRGMAWDQNIIQRRKLSVPWASPIKRPWTHSIQLFALEPDKSGAPGAEEPFISGAHQKISAKFVYIHWHRPARLARIQHKHRSLRMTGRSHTSRI